MLKLLVLMSSLVATTALAQQTFGVYGRNGRDGRNGQHGENGRSISINVDGAPQSYEISGSNGSDALDSGEDGEHAYDCRQPREAAYNLVGASGGNGGNAGIAGNGGNGGSASLNLASDANIASLKLITIRNKGGRAGLDGQVEGRGGIGCECQQFEWRVLFCTWRLTYTTSTNPQPVDAWRTETQQCYPDHRRQIIAPPPVPSDRWSDKIYAWQLSNQEEKRFTCTDGRRGKNGTRRTATNGSYGQIGVYVGGGTTQELNQTALGRLINNTYSISRYVSEWRSGLTALLNPASDVMDTFYFAKFHQLKVKFEWQPKTTPQQQGAAELPVSATLDGPPSNPAISLSVPKKLTYKITKTNDLTVVKFTHLLGSTDPTKINECARHHAKGSLVCEFSDQCRYEDGECIPR